MAADDDDIDYRCRKCGTIVPRGTHHKMQTCKMWVRLCGSGVVRVEDIVAEWGTQRLD